jgi:hypothetical protein
MNALQLQYKYKTRLLCVHFVLASMTFLPAEVGRRDLCPEQFEVIGNSAL